MISTENGFTTIECDKCHTKSKAPESMYNDVFWNEGWALHKGRKYIHLCNQCLSPKSRKSMAWAREKFKHLIQR